MPTYYSRSGFTIEITRLPGSNFSGNFVSNSTQVQFTTSQLSVFINQPGGYIGEFSNATENDPTTFTILDYDTSDFIAEITFPLMESLILQAGIEGESTSDLSIAYPLQTFSFTNPGFNVVWVCSPLPEGCDGLEQTIINLPQPKVIGNLLGCSTDDYKGDITKEPVCNSESLDEFFLFQIRDAVTDDLLYSQVECCCPIVSAGPPPGFVCTCPDWGKATSYNQTLFSSSVRLREWILSNAGSKQDCKHIMAAKRIMNIEQPIYSDPPYSAPPAPPTPG